MLKSFAEKALLLLNIKVIGHATFLTTSLSFLNSLSVCAVHRVNFSSECRPETKRSVSLPCLSAHN